MSLSSRVLGRLKREFVRTFKVQKQNMNSTKIYSAKESQVLISDLIYSGVPFLASRFGTTESRVFLDQVEGEIALDSINNLWKLSGVFPPTPEIAERFTDQLRQVAAQIDICSVRSAWYEQIFWNQDEAVLRHLQIQPILMDLEGLSPLGNSSSWVSSLKGRNVLVIHPFARSIKSQYLKRELLFSDSDWLPEFNLLVLESVQSLSGKSENIGYTDWFEALESMKKKISELEFDVALVGAGAYGMFLGTHIKELGKQAIHVGGALQLFFGIKGSRWTDPLTPEFIKDSERPSWVWPSETETPERYLEVENGAYWDSGNLKC
jgi:hypothetical protein